MTWHGRGWPRMAGAQRLGRQPAMDCGRGCCSLCGLFALCGRADVRCGFARPCQWRSKVKARHGLHPFCPFFARASSIQIPSSPSCSPPPSGPLPLFCRSRASALCCDISCPWRSLAIAHRSLIHPHSRQSISHRPPRYDSSIYFLPPVPAPHTRPPSPRVTNARYPPAPFSASAGNPSVAPGDLPLT